MQRQHDARATAPSNGSGATHSTRHASASGHRATRADPLATRIQLRMASARPRLLRLARAQGVPPDAAEDVAQEALLEAWRHLDDLTTLEGFDTWLNAICRNACRRYARARGRLVRWQAGSPDLVARMDGAESEEGGALDIADPLAVDPAEELIRQDLEVLLVRALGHLSAGAREMVELCYLAEMPQREAALRLGLTISALEARLHRARRQLRGVLGGALHEEARAFGLALDDRLPAGWRETRLWCHSCGQGWRQGAFVRATTGGMSLRLRCPFCLRQVDTRGLVPLGGARSFLPAYNRLIRYLTGYLAEGVSSGWQGCPFCGARQRVRIAEMSEAEGQSERPGVKALMACAACGEHVDSPVGALAIWAHPAARRFMTQHPHWVQEPETLTSYMGRQVLRVRLTDVASAGQLTLLADAQTLRVLAVL